MAYTLLHNPRCSKSRAALALLEERGIDHTVRKYLDEPLSADELRILRKRLGRKPAEWIRWNEDDAKPLDRDAPEQELIQAMAAHPKLMERPILIRDDEALVGRPGPEALEPLL
jgi:arsenate reductase (glutaredoxin)